MQKSWSTVSWIPSMCKKLLAGEKWIEGVIIKHTNNVTYQVKITYGLVHNHIDSPGISCQQSVMPK